jgi:hypothetical protein
MKLVQGSADVTLIRTLMYNKLQLVINNNTIATARTEFMNTTLQELGIDPSASACDRLLAFCRIREDISFIAVTHSVNSGFVTMKKNVRESKIMNISKDVAQDNSNAINLEEISSWRNLLKVDDGKKILVAFAWSQHEHQRKLFMFPEVLSADVTFGVCKEQRNLFRICGIDGELKVFQAMNCFMPSKQYRAYDWAINVAFPKLVGREICKFNSLFTSDQEMALVLSIRKFVNDKPHDDAVTSLGSLAGHSCHRFDMFHIFTKEWRNKVCFVLHWYIMQVCRLKAHLVVLYSIHNRLK